MLVLLTNKNMLASIKKINGECLESVVTLPPMLLDDVLVKLKSEIESTDDIKTSLKNIKLYSTVGLLLLEEKDKLVVSLSTGGKIMRDNKFFGDLIALMNTSAFKTFRENHMSKDIQASLIYFEIYEMLKTFYIEKTGVDIPDDIAVELLKTIMDNREYRGPLISILRAYIDSGGGKRDKMYRKLSKIMFSTSALAINDL